jgi:integrase
MAQIYRRHLQKCSHKDDRNYNRCDCPVYISHNRKRWSAATDDWQTALKQAAKLDAADSAPTRITVDDAVTAYLIKRSGKRQDVAAAPYKDRYMLLKGSKRQQSLSRWAAEKKFVRLDSITAAALDAWRGTWVFRENSFAMKIHSAAMKAFFTWAVKFDHLAKSPFDKLDPVTVEEVPTLPLTPEEVSALLSTVVVCRERDRETMTTIMLLMRWSGLSIGDASCLRRDALGKDNRLRTYRKKTGEYVHVLLPTFVAVMLREQPGYGDFFFWDATRRKRHSQVSWVEKRLTRMYDKANIFPRGGQRFRDTFAVEFLIGEGTVENLAMLLGHNTTETTQRHYMPWIKSRQKKLDEAVSRSWIAQGVVEPQRTAIQ